MSRKSLDMCKLLNESTCCFLNQGFIFLVTIFLFGKKYDLFKNTSYIQNNICKSKAANILSQRVLKYAI